MTAHQTWLWIDRHVAPSNFPQSSSILKRLTNLIKGCSRSLYWHETYQERIMYKTWIADGYITEPKHRSIMFGAAPALPYCKHRGMCDTCLIFTVLVFHYMLASKGVKMMQPVLITVGILLFCAGRFCTHLSFSPNPRSLHAHPLLHSNEIFM